MKIASEADFDQGCQALEQHGFAQVSTFLDDADAEKLRKELDAIQDWDFAVTAANGPVVIEADELAAMGPNERSRLLGTLRRQSRSGYSMAYYRRDVLPGPRPVANAFANWIQSAEFVGAMRKLTGNEAIVRADAHASLYREGSYLRSHDDTYAGKRRLYAYVLNLTRAWEPDCGGLLHFETEGLIEGALVPHFNSLSIFRVPRMHFVSQVASYATEKRLAITGWLFAE